MKSEIKQGFVRVYCRAFDIGAEQMELMLTLVQEPKWKSKTENRNLHILAQCQSINLEIRDLL